ncbi:hypothetical protein AAEX28_04020 [Lentisphaerota bacterium WC36G]|nr:hypothetical protein LJT99_06890 [Lentisphaerae bacterium WC36]
MTTNQMIAKAIEDKAIVLARNEIEKRKYDKTLKLQEFCRLNDISKEELKNIIDEIINPTKTEPPKELIEAKKQEVIDQMIKNLGGTYNVAN